LPKTKSEEVKPTEIKEATVTQSEPTPPKVTEEPKKPEFTPAVEEPKKPEVVMVEIT